MEEILLFILSVFFGAFFFILALMFCLRLSVCLRDKDRKHFCFRRKKSGRDQSSGLHEGGNRPSNLGYTAAPDENINELTICQPYVYEDGRSTGMRMIANLPMAISFTSQSGLPPNSLFSLYQQMSLGGSPLHLHGGTLLAPSALGPVQPPPPDYLQAQQQLRYNNYHHILPEKCISMEELIEEPPPPTYDECMNNTSTWGLLYTTPSQLPLNPNQLLVTPTSISSFNTK